MHFFNLINNLKEEYSSNCLIRKNDTILLAPGKIPKCKHMFFAPVSDEYINTCLINSYCDLPKDYIDLLKYSNGMNLFSIKIKSNKFCFAHSLFVIFGIPCTPPYNRKDDMEEPFDVRIEDLARHKNIPKNWLKCGTYIKDYDFDIMIDIFIDCESSEVFACKKNSDEIVEKWKNLDDCLCSIFNSLIDCNDEYNWIPEKP